MWNRGKNQFPDRTLSSGMAFNRQFEIMGTCETTCETRGWSPLFQFYLREETSGRVIGRSDTEKSALASPVDDTSCAPVSSRICLAIFVQCESSQWTERRMPPLRTRPS